jgi:cell division protein ZapA
MAQVSITINGRVYRMACDDGQEEHLVRLARDVDARIGQLRSAFGEIGDTRLAVMAAIMVADELSEMRRRVRAVEHDIEGLRDSRVSEVSRIEASERAFADAIDGAASRIERIAHRLNDGITNGAALG